MPKKCNATIEEIENALQEFKKRKQELQYDKPRKNGEYKEIETMTTYFLTPQDLYDFANGLTAKDYLKGPNTAYEDQNDFVWEWRKVYNLSEKYFTMYVKFRFIHDSDIVLLYCHEDDYE